MKPPLSVEQLAEFKKFHGQPVTHLPGAVLRHDPGKLKTFADLVRPRVRRDNFCERDRDPRTVERINEESFNLLVTVFRVGQDSRYCAVTYAHQDNLRR